jgi:hypothetical protein
MRTLLALLCLFSCAAHAGSSSWETTDTLMLSGVAAVVVLDWGQTRNLTHQPREKEYFEKTNFTLPAHPTTAQVDRSFALGLAATAGLAYVLPQDYRRWFLGVALVVETTTVVHNHQIGLHLQF